MGGNQDFRLEKLEESFRTCLQDDTILLDPYLEGFRELNKLFVMLAKSLGFIGSDLMQKVKRLCAYRSDSSNGKSYVDLRKMVEFESKSTKLIERDAPTDKSGTRSFLRLHRALEFMLLFLDEAQKAGDEADLGKLSRTAYEQSLAKHHSYLVQKAAKLAMQSLGTKQQLIENLYGDRETGSQKCAAIVPKVVNAMKSAFQKSTKIYEDFDLKLK